MMRIFLTDKLFMEYEDDMLNVLLYTDSMERNKLDKEKLYLNGHYVYKYRGKLKDGMNLNKIPCGIYKVEGVNTFFGPRTEKEKKDMSADNIYELDSKAILQDIQANMDKFVTAEDVEIISNNAEIFVPIIEDSDDFLKKLVKKAIIAKKINLANYKDKLENKWGLSNLRHGLKKKAPVSMKTFKVWCEILGLDFDITLYDNGCDTYAPLEDPIVMNKDEI